MPQSPKDLDRIGEETSEENEMFELEDTAIETTSPAFESGQIALRNALNMDRHEMDAIDSLPEGPTPDTSPYFSPPEGLPPLSAPETWKHGTTLAARRRRTRSTSPSLKLTKPLASMGNSLHWRLSVLHKINDIQYTL